MKVPGPRISLESARSGLEAMAHAVGDADGEMEPRALLAVQACDLIDDLLMAATPGGRNSKPRTLSPGVLKQAKAVQFVFTKKSGLVFGRSNTVGVALANLGTNFDGTIRWSAPCFLASRAISLGVTIGAHQSSTMFLVISEAAAEHFRTDGHLSSKVAEKHLTVAKYRTTGPPLDTTQPLPDVVILAHAEGLMVDVPLFEAGALEVDAVKNSEVYGHDAAEQGPEVIMGGTVLCPPEFILLHRRLNEVAAMA